MNHNQKLSRGWASMHYRGHNVHIPGTSNYLRSRTFQSYFNMIVRTQYISSRSWDNYGGRGITVCQKWLDSFDTFLSDMGHRPPGKTLDRINPNHGYTPSNCRWATASEQSSNQRRWAQKKVA